MEFKDQNWKTIPKPESGRTRVWDDEMYQLGFQILSTGAVSWIVRWRVPWREHQVTKKVGIPGVMSPTAARKAAKSIMNNFTKESDEEASDTTAKDMLEDFYKKWIMRPGEDREYEQALSYREIQRWYLDKYLTGDECEFGKMLLSEINEGTITTLLTETVEGRVNQNRIQALVRAAYNWAARQPAYLRIHNPVTGHKRNTETPKTDRLFEEDVRRLGKAWRESKDPLKNVCIWPLLVGSRKRAALYFGKGALDLNERVIRFDPKEEGLKGCEIIYLPECIMEVTKSLPSETDREAFKRAWKRLRKKAKVTETTHDMRRTFCSFGGDLHYSAGIMNLITHQASGDGVVADTYYQPANKTYQQIVDHVGLHLWTLLHENPTDENEKLMSFNLQAAVKVTHEVIDVEKALSPIEILKHASNAPDAQSDKVGHGRRGMTSY